MEQEIKKIKDETEVLKQEKIAEAKNEQETKKKEIQAEKAQMLSKIKDDLRTQKEMQTQQDQQDMNQVFDYINMDDGFDAAQDAPAFGSSALQKKSSAQERDRSPAAARAKFKPPEVKKHSQLKKGMAEAMAEAEEQLPEDQAGASDDDADWKDKDGPRKRTFTFSQALEGADPDEQNDEDGGAAGDIQSRKEQIKQQLLSLQDDN